MEKGQGDRHQKREADEKDWKREGAVRKERDDEGRQQGQKAG